MYSTCFTGHRKILGSYYNTDNPTTEWAMLKGRLCSVINTFMTENITTFYSGMAIGVDTVAAEAVLSVRKPGVRLVAAVPFPAQPSKWISSAKANYNRILSLCDEVQVVNPDPYELWKMHARDRFMVDNSSYVIAVWDGRPGGGTYYTLKYGFENNRMVYVINPETWEEHWLEEVP